MFDEYQYAELATVSTIRLIKLEEKKVNNTITCVIKHVEQSTVDYYALSYVWGDPMPSRHIYLGSGSEARNLVSLHENLWRFLDHAWNRRMFDRWFWTDRISLNQEDDNEKAQQIPRMGEIYRNAKQVVAWLGMSEEEGEHLEPLQSFGSRAYDLYRVKGQLPQETQLAATAVRNNEYWGRTWVVQEVANAKQVTVIMGNLEMDFTTVVDIFLPFPETGQVPSLIYLRSLRVDGGRSELWHLLRTLITNNYRSERLHDRVYGGLGLIAAHDDGTSPLDYIVVDYGKSPTDVILDAVLESRPPWGKYSAVQEMTGMLLEKNGMVHEPLFDAFRKYVGSSRTSERHKHLARLALEACDALGVLFSVPGSRPGCWSVYETFRALRESFHYGGFKPTVWDSAIMLGVSIVLGFYQEDEMAPIFENWKACREPALPTRSPWRCALHPTTRGQARPSRRHCQAAPTSVEEENIVAETKGRGPMRRPEETVRAEANAALDTPSLCPRRIVEACSQFSNLRSCDGSTMMFEMPEAGFRMTFDQRTRETDSSGWYHGAICMQFRHPETGREGDGAGRK